MKKLVGVMVTLACLSAAAQVFADPPEGRGYKKHHRHEYKEEYWDGDCRVERKYKNNGDYKEERECEGAPYYQPRYSDNYAPPQAYGYAPPPPVSVRPRAEAEIVVRPPEVVIEAPSVVIEPPRVRVR